MLGLLVFLREESNRRCEEEDRRRRDDRDERMASERAVREEHKRILHEEAAAQEVRHQQELVIPELATNKDWFKTEKNPASGPSRCYCCFRKAKREIYLQK
ncbi:hypothetical protein GQ600_3382 [Phytophthora cactorum]|nr:hypothetical protein GQ600_3382 [Phytophthora cactorum]